MRGEDNITLNRDDLSLGPVDSKAVESEIETKVVHLFSIVSKLIQSCNLSVVEGTPRM